MTDLLDFALEADGGFDNWKYVTGVDLRLTLRGYLFDIKQHPNGLRTALAEGSDDRPENARRVWVTIHELRAEDWSIGGHTDWLRDYTSALDEVGDYTAPMHSSWIER